MTNAKRALDLSNEFVRAWTGEVLLARREEARVAILRALNAVRAEVIGDCEQACFEEMRNLDGQEQYLQARGAEKAALAVRHKVL